MSTEFKKRTSQINGFGIYVTKKILKDTKYYYLPLDIIYLNPKSKCVRIADNKYVYDDKVLNWVNHSCNPNSKLDINRSVPVLIAIRDILKNEEITVDYNQTEMGIIKVECTCGSDDCRKWFYQS
jgi:hypothetical protein